MIKVKFENKKCLIKGSIDLGYIGKYENLEYGDDCLYLDDTLDEIIEDMNNLKYAEGYDFTWHFLNRYVTEINEANIAKAIEDYFNAQEEKVQKNISYVNGQFLSYIHDFLENCTYPFWEIKEIVKWDLMPKTDDEDEITDFVYENAFDYKELKEDFSNMEDLFKKSLPTFDLEKFFENIETSSLGLKGARMVFQCSDKFDAQILCAGYAEIQENLEFFDWHNH